MNDKNLKKSVVSGLVWKFSELVSIDAVGFIVSVILARLLMPEDFGEISLVNIFITLANVFVVYGLGTALIQKKDADSLDFSSVFYFNFGISIVLYIVLWISAPLVADFYATPDLVWVLRVLGLKVPIASISTVQNAYLSRQMAFKKMFLASLIGTIASAVIGIGMAYSGFGVWSLVAQTLVSTGLNVVVMFFIITWKPRLEFSWKRLKRLVRYGWKLLVSGFIKVGYDQLSGLIIGKLYTTDDLAYYTRGKKYPELVVSGINSSIGTVVFPAFAQYQDEKDMLKKMVRQSIGITTYVMTPLMLGMAALAKPLVLFLLTEKWIDCVPFLQIACLYYALQPVQTANLQAIRAVGRSDIILWLDIIKRGIGILLIVCFMHKGVVAIALAPVGMSLVASIVNVFPNRKLIGYSYWEQFQDIIPNLITAGSMALGVWILSSYLMRLQMNSLLVILAGVLCGAVYYIVISLLTHNKNFVEVWNLLKGILVKK